LWQGDSNTFIIPDKAAFVKTSQPREIVPYSTVILPHPKINN